MVDFHNAPRLVRSVQGRPAAPERIIHLGLGNFSRAHQAWFTEHAPDASSWGITAFTGRSERLVKALAPQDDVYTLITSGSDGDEFEVISSLSSVYAGTDIAQMRRSFANPEIVIVTSTVTEAGYMRDRNGDLDLADPSVSHDLATLSADHLANDLSTIPAKVVAGLLARREAGAGDITVLPCDNLAENGAAFRKVVEQAAQRVDPSLDAWMQRHVAWATSMVDRITPATTEEEKSSVTQAQGWIDEAPVRTEPFREWVIAGDFPGGHPAWQDAGAVFTDDVKPYEHRKLWMLNGAHSTLAYAGSVFGYADVAHAVTDPMLKRWVDEWWDLAAPYLPIPSDEYRKKLLERFSNPRIHHHLVQIAADGSQKLPVRIAPVAKMALEQGASIVPAARAVASWVLFLREHDPKEIRDVEKEEVLRLASDTGADAVRNIVASLDRELGASEVFVAEVSYQLDSVSEAARAARHTNR